MIFDPFSTIENHFQPVQTVHMKNYILSCDNTIVWNKLPWSILHGFNISIILFVSVLYSDNDKADDHITKESRYLGSNDQYINL